MPSSPFCRFCREPLTFEIVDLGMSPLCECYLEKSQLNRMEPFYPLKVYVCTECFLAQIEEYVRPDEIFTEYAYFSSYSISWLQHCRNYVQMMVERFSIGDRHQVVELASNDGYLLQYFVEEGVPVIGVEPAKNIARVAIKKGIPTITEFFGINIARKMVEAGYSADLLLGNNVLAQVPDINDFVAGMKILLKPEGVITMEFPHLFRLIEGNQFDTIYHEHFSYFSLFVVERVFAQHGITLFDAEEIKTHGGSIRIYGCHVSDTTKDRSTRISHIREMEIDSGYHRPDIYSTFAGKVEDTKRNLLKILIDIKRKGKRIAGYGAPGKGNTLLNYCGIRSDFIDYLVDRNPYKHGKYTPGTHIKIFPPELIQRDRPDYLFILPWNLKDEIIRQMSFIKEWGGRFIVPIPEAEIISDF
jgi:hypothetical protein